MSRTEIPLHQHVDAYIGVRQALGSPMQAQRILLHEFVEFVDTHGSGEPVRAQLALDWACAMPNKRGGTGAANRLSVARGFLAYLRATIPETEVPSHQLLASTGWRKPFLFKPEQITTLVERALAGRPRGSLRPHTLSTLIGLLASTGLRPGEVLRLTIADLQLDQQPPHLRVMETKFGKSRLVPLHPSTADQIKAYAQKRSDLYYAGLSDTLFVSEKDLPLNYSSLGRWFSRLCRQLGFWPADDTRRPSLYSLRHSFAVERLRQWYHQGKDAQAMLPNLSVYLGHLGPQETYWYLTSTPELLTAAAERFERHVTPGGLS